MSATRTATPVAASPRSKNDCAAPSETRASEVSYSYIPVLK
jgi:hypothetical protein